MEFRFGSLIISSKFECGNLALVETVVDSKNLIQSRKTTKNASENNNKSITNGNHRILDLRVDHDLLLWTKPDCAGTVFENSNRSWFFFSVRGYKRGSLLRAKFMNLNRQTKLYSQGYTPLFKAVDSKTGYKTSWKRLRERTSWELVDDQFRLTFVHRFTEMRGSKTFFAFAYPWTYSEVQKQLACLEANFGHNCPSPAPIKAASRVESCLPTNSPSIYLHRELVCYTLEGRRLDLLTITDWSGWTGEREDYFDPLLFPNRAEMRSWKFSGKKIVLISARVHPGETQASHVMNGIINLLTTHTASSSSEDADKRQFKLASTLRNKFVFKLLPMLNPDGVVAGHYRTDSRGVNLNRVYLTPEFTLFPTIYAVKALAVYYHTNYAAHLAYAPFLADLLKDEIPAFPMSADSVGWTADRMEEEREEEDEEYQPADSIEDDLDGEDISSHASLKDAEQNKELSENTQANQSNRVIRNCPSSDSEDDDELNTTLLPSKPANRQSRHAWLFRQRSSMDHRSRSATLSVAGSGSQTNNALTRKCRSQDLPQERRLEKPLSPAGDSALQLSTLNCRAQDATVEANITTASQDRRISTNNACCYSKSNTRSSSESGSALGSNDSDSSALVNVNKQYVRLVEQVKSLSRSKHAGDSGKIESLISQLMEQLTLLRRGDHLGGLELRSTIKPPDSGLAFYLDLHGHCAKRGCFIYGNWLQYEDQTNNTTYMVDSIVYSILVGLNSPFFDFAGCNFSVRNMYAKDKYGQFTKEGAGRVALWKHLGLPHCYTVECNYNSGPLQSRLASSSSQSLTANVVESSTRQPTNTRSSYNNPGVRPYLDPAAFADVGCALLVSILDLMEVNPCSRLTNLTVDPTGLVSAPLSAISITNVLLANPELRNMQSLRAWASSFIRDLAASGAMYDPRKEPKRRIVRKKSTTRKYKDASDQNLSTNSKTTDDLSETLLERPPTSCLFEEIDRTVEPDAVSNPANLVVHRLERLEYNANCDPIIDKLCTTEQQQSQQVTRKECPAGRISDADFKSKSPESKETKIKKLFKTGRIKRRKNKSKSDKSNGERPNHRQLFQQSLQKWRNSIASVRDSSKAMIAVNNCHSPSGRRANPSSTDSVSKPNRTRRLFNSSDHDRAGKNDNRLAPGLSSPDDGKANSNESRQGKRPERASRCQKVKMKTTEGPSSSSLRVAGKRVSSLFTTASGKRKGRNRSLNATAATSCEGSGENDNKQSDCK